jgi:hypothetical protein
MRKNIKNLIENFLKLLGFYFLFFSVYSLINPNAANRRFAWFIVITAALVTAAVFLANKISTNIYKINAIASILTVITVLILHVLFYGTKRFWFIVICFSSAGVLGFVLSIVERKIRNWHIEKINKKLAELNGTEDDK